MAQDYTQAFAWFTKSAENGNTKGQVTLAKCHLYGWGVERDVHEAGRLFRLAALQGDAEAQWQVIRGGELDCGPQVRLARKYFNLAAAQGHPQAVARVEETRRDRLRCVMCGAHDAPSECQLCHRVRYCNLECSHAHWHRGGGFQFPTRGSKEEPHNDTCKRTYERSG
jgi:TPR repeat protein